MDKKESQSLGYLQYGCFQHPEHSRVFRLLRPPHNFSPVDRIGFLLPCTGKDANIIIGESSPDKEQPQKHAWVRRYGYIDSGGNLWRGEESIGYILVRRESAHIVTVECER